MFLKAKLKLSDKEADFLLRMMNFHQVSDPEIYLQIIEKGLSRILNEEAMITAVAKDLITDILTKCMSYRFDVEFERFINDDEGYTLISRLSGLDIKKL